MTQQEFDKQMMDWNEELKEALEPFKARMRHINDERNNIKIKRAALEIEYMTLGQEYARVCEQITDIKNHFHTLKHQFVVDNPKETMEEEGACTHTEAEPQGAEQREADATYHEAVPQETGPRDPTIRAMAEAGFQEVFDKEK